MNDREMLSRLAEGDRTAIRELVQTHRDRMVAIARRRGTLNLEDAQDVVQALMTRWLKSPPGTGRYTNLMGFLTIAVDNQTADWVEQQEKQQGRRPSLPGKEHDATVPEPPKAIFPLAENVSAAELEELLAVAKADPAVTRQDLIVIDTYYAQALSREQCAAELRIPVNRFDQQVHVAKKRLAAALARALKARTQPADPEELQERKEQH